MIPYGRQEITQEDVDAVVEVLRSDFLTQGPCISKFEALIANYCKVNHAVASNSATSSLHLACLALGLNHGDYLWTSPISFVASANCARYCGANIDFVDIDLSTGNMSVDNLARKLSIAKKLGCLPKIVVPVHLAGRPCDMKAIYDMGQQYGFKIIEDASHAIGAKYDGQPVGDCRYSDVTIFSFHPVKIITTAEGGVSLTNCIKLANKMETLRSHGITRKTDCMDQEPDGSWYYQQIDLGFNYRMTEIQAALGVSQIKRLDEYIERRHAIADRYDVELAPLPLILPFRDKLNYSSLHLYPIRLKKPDFRKLVFEKLKAKGVGVNVHYIPIHLQPYYKKLGFKVGDFPNAEKYYSEIISLPIYPTLTSKEQDYIIKELKVLLS